MTEVERAIVDALDSMKWEFYDERELRAHHKGFSYYLRQDGNVQAYYGGSQLVDFKAPEAVTTFALKAGDAKQMLIMRLSDSLNEAKGVKS